MNLSHSIIKSKPNAGRARVDGAGDDDIDRIPRGVDGGGAGIGVGIAYEETDGRGSVDDRGVRDAAHGPWYRRRVAHAQTGAPLAACICAGR